MSSGSTSALKYGNGILPEQVAESSELRTWQYLILDYDYDYVHEHEHDGVDAKREARHNKGHGALMEGRLWDETLAALV